MKIGISLFQYIPGKVGGAGEYLERLIANLPSQLKISDTIYLFGNKGNLGSFQDIQHPQLKLCEYSISDTFIKVLRMFDLFLPNTFSVMIAKKINQYNPDVVLFPQQSIFPHGIKAIKVVTVFDFLHEYFPQNFSLIERNIRRRKEKYLINKADGIISISYSTQMDLCKICGYKKKKKVIYLGGDGRKIDRTDSSIRFEKPYILYPSHSYPHKNHLKLINAFIQFKKETPDNKGLLVLTGKILSAKLQAIINSSAVKEHVRHLGFVSRSELDTLIHDCEAIFFPSLFEGFGIPVLEGIQRGVPVFCSDLPVFREIAGDAVYYFDPDRSESMIEQFKKIFINHELSVDMEAFHQITVSLNWKKCAKETLQFIKDIKMI